MSISEHKMADISNLASKDGGPKASTEPSRVTVLTVDDDAGALLLARTTLEGADFLVEAAENGVRALEVFEKTNPDIILLDVMMPEMDGFEACLAIREMAHGRHVPILMMTGLDDVESINRAYDVGATDFLSKPINFAILAHRVRYMLRAKRTADELRSSQVRLATAQRIARIAYWQWECESGLLSCSEDIERLIGAPLPQSATTPRDFSRFVHPDDRKLFEDIISQAMRNLQTCSVEHRVLHPDGSHGVIHQEINTYSDRDGRVTSVLGTMQDISERKRAEQRIRYLAYYDSVTGLPNRSLLKEHVGVALRQAKRHRRAAALMFLDLDNFKRVNDTFGHSAGDAVLQEVASRLSHCTRDSDFLARQSDEGSGEATAWLSGNTVARLGGDEFVILLTEMRTPEDAAVSARRVNEALALPFVVKDVEVHLGCSVGISTFPEDGDDTETLLKHADAAMYHAKMKGKGRYQFYTRAINARALERLAMESSLRKALDHEQFFLEYQPQICLRTGRVVGAEALIRWNNSDLGIVYPEDFISVAEEIGFISQLGEWVLKTACAQGKRWQRIGEPPLRISVNLSAAQFVKQGFSKTVARILSDSGLDARCLELEITEGVLMENVDSNIRILNELRALGVRISIDDFGTEYSSLMYLKRFSLDAIKIDRSFVRDITNNPGDASIVAATINLGHSLQMSVVAEGVEEEAQLDFLRANECDEVQGNLLSVPQSVEQLSDWLEANASNALRRFTRPPVLASVAHKVSEADANEPQSWDSASTFG
jgi:PAS domain S-box-containing protein